MPVTTPTTPVIVHIGLARFVTSPTATPKQITAAARTLKDQRRAANTVFTGTILLFTVAALVPASSTINALTSGTTIPPWVYIAVAAFTASALALGVAVIIDKANRLRAVTRDIPGHLLLPVPNVPAATVPATMMAAGNHYRSPAHQDLWDAALTHARIPSRADVANDAALLLQRDELITARNGYLTSAEQHITARA